MPIDDLYTLWPCLLTKSPADSIYPFKLMKSSFVPSLSGCYQAPITEGTKYGQLHLEAEAASLVLGVGQPVELKAAEHEA